MKRTKGISSDRLDRLRIIGESSGATRVKKAYSQPPNDGMTGLQVYDLRGPAQRLNPVVSMLRNEIPRRQAPRGSSGIHWKAITGVNTGNILPGVSEGNRNAPIAHTTADYSSGYAQLGMENFSTDESKYVINNTDLNIDVDTLMRLDTLESLMNAEERVILGGNASVAFGVAPTPVGEAVAGGGALTSAATIAYVVGLTFEGILLASVANGVATEFSRTNADGSVDMVQGGSSNKSLASAPITPAAGERILWKWASIPGAAGYAIYIGPSAGGAAGAHLAGIVAVNEFLQSTNPSGVTQTADAITGDHSRNPLVFDGIIAQLVKPGSGAQVISLNGEVPTINPSGTFDELDEAFRKQWEATRSGPTRIIASAQTRVTLSKIVMANGGGGPNIQVTVQIGAGGVTTGMQVERILNPYTGQFVPFVSHPFMPEGMMLMETQRLPYSLNGVTSPWIIETRQEYWSQNWVRRTRKTEFGVYVSEGLIGSIPFAHVLFQDIGKL